jgi:uncharacterized protein (DUF433 family)
MRRVRPTAIDPRELPAYGLVEASHYLDIAIPTLKSWLIGRGYQTAAGIQRFESVMRPACDDPLTLSFTNLVEAQVLGTIRKRHGVRLCDIRVAVRWVEAKVSVPHPLANYNFLTDGADLFVESFGRLIAASREGQYVFPEIVREGLTRIERDEQGLARRLYPLRFSAPRLSRVVAIDPLVSFGRPVLDGTGIPVAVLAERHRAGEPVPEIAEDPKKVEQAIAWEEAVAA